MDVLLVRSTVFALPSQHRVDAIVHDGAADLRLWPGRGPDSDLREAYGDGLAPALEAERERLGGGDVPMFRPVRVHPGRLHCDFLLWIPTRPSEPGGERQPAPDAAGIERAVVAALEFAAERDVMRVAFPALGWGPGELDRRIRLEHIARRASRFAEERRAAGQAVEIERVLVCEPLGSVVREVEARLRSVVRGTIEPSERSHRPSAAKTSERARGGPQRKRGRQKGLDPEQLAHGRLVAQPYDMRRIYGEGDWLAHGKFGIGRVERVTPEGAIVVLFESGEERKMVHGR